MILELFIGLRATRNVRFWNRNRKNANRADDTITVRHMCHKWQHSCEIRHITVKLSHLLRPGKSTLVRFLREKAFYSINRRRQYPLVACVFARGSTEGDMKPPCRWAITGRPRVCRDGWRLEDARRARSAGTTAMQRTPAEGRTRPGTWADRAA